MHLQVADPDLDDELPANYPAARPRRYGACARLRLGTATMPCVFLTCRHNLLSDELTGPKWDGESSLQGRPTCSLRFAAEGKHNAAAIGETGGWCVSTVEDWLRRALVALLLGLGVDEFIRTDKHGKQRFREPGTHEHLRASTRFGDISNLVDAAFKSLPPLNAPPVRHLTRAEAEQFYPGRVSPRYGKPRQERAVSRALGGSVAPRTEQEAGNPEKTAATTARESNPQDGDARHVDFLLIDKHKCD
jgi:hypothetical protein